MWPSWSHVTNAIIKNAISSKSRKHNHLTTHLKPVLWYRVSIEIPITLCSVTVVEAIPLPPWLEPEITFQSHNFA